MNSSAENIKLLLDEEVSESARCRAAENLKGERGPEVEQALLQAVTEGQHGKLMSPLLFAASKSLAHIWVRRGSFDMSDFYRLPDRVRNYIGYLVESRAPELYEKSGLKSHLLAFVSDGTQLFLHLDLAGIDVLLEQLNEIRSELQKDDCPHTHLFSGDYDGLSVSTMIDGSGKVGTSIHHLKIYGWNEEWAREHGFKKVYE